MSKRYEFKINFGSTSGGLSVAADSEEMATDAMLSIVGERLAKAFPELDINYEVECEASWESENEIAGCDLENLKVVASQFKEEMVEYICDNWDELGMGEKDMPDAETYLGHDVDHMTQEEIDEEVSEIQRAYYEEGEADLEEIVNKYSEMIRLSEKK